MRMIDRDSLGFVPSDIELLTAWREGDTRAGNELFRRHYSAVHRFLANKVDDDVEDVLQRTFEICATSSDRFAGRSSFRAYLLGIARNLVLQHWERRRRTPTRESIEDTSIHDLGAGPSTLLTRDQAHRRLLEALRRMRLRDQILLELSFWEEFTGPQLAEFLGVPEDTARSRLRRAKLELAAEVNRVERSGQCTHESTSDDLERWAADVRMQIVREPG